ncbi:transposase [Streptomyces sp. NPDC004976]
MRRQGTPSPAPGWPPRTATGRAALSPMVLRRLPSLASCIRVASPLRRPISYRANLRQTLKSCSRALLNDQLWELLEPLLPPWPDEGARSAAGAGSAQCLQGILYVLHTGIGWEDLPQELGFRSGMTCWRRIKRGSTPGCSTICIGSCLPS